jgi:Putative silver efflux pump
LLNNVATFTRDGVPTNLNQTNIQPTYEVYASVTGRDLGSVSDDIHKIVPSCNGSFRLATRFKSSDRFKA